MPAETETPEIPESSPVDYASSAELFAVQRLGRKQSLFYQRFDNTAEAMRFAVEDMPAGAANIVLETEFGRYDAAAIAKIYGGDEFPLARRASAPGAAPK